MSAASSVTSTRTPALGSRFGTRIVARLLDFVLLSAFGLGLGVLTGFGALWFAVVFASVVSYFVGLDVCASRTLGKALLGLRIVASDGARPPTVGEALRREAFVVVGAVPFVGPVLAVLVWSAIAWSTARSVDGIGIHDRVAGTRFVASR